MKKLIRLTTVAAVVITLAQTLQAALITGSMGFSGLGVTINTSSAGTATEVTSWINPVVSGTSGTFAPPSPYALANNTPVTLDRKSTRLNSSHLGISYAVFCLK